MTDDIVRRLRDFDYRSDVDAEMMIAADEIERLRTEVERLTRERDYLTAGIADLIDCQSHCDAGCRSQAFEKAAKAADEIAKGFRVYRDHWPQAEGAETAAAHIRALAKEMK